MYIYNVPSFVVLVNWQRLKQYGITRENIIFHHLNCDFKKLIEFTLRQCNSEQWIPHDGDGKIRRRYILTQHRMNRRQSVTTVETRGLKFETVRCPIKRNRCRTMITSLGRCETEIGQIHLMKSNFEKKEYCYSSCREEEVRERPL